VSEIAPETRAAPSLADEDPRREYAFGMVRLGLWYARRLASRRGPDVQKVPEREIEDILSRWVNLFRLTDLWDGSLAGDVASGARHATWDELLRQLVPMVRESSLDDTATLEERGLELLRPGVERQLLTPAPVVDRPFGCWTYRLIGAGILDRPGMLGQLTNVSNLKERTLRLAGVPTPPRHCELHFENFYAPHSPFADPSLLVQSLRSLIAEVKRDHPQVSLLWCNSWLNSRDVFSDLFPPEWRLRALTITQENSGGLWLARRRVNTDNWFGQFVSKTGGFHDRLAQQFRDSGGVFPFPTFRCHAGIDATDEHLRRLEQELDTEDA